MNISVIGGDARIVELVKILRKNQNDMCLYGMEKSEQLREFNHAKNIEAALQYSDLVVTSIPMSKDGIWVNAPFSNQEISVEELLNVAKNKKIIMGNLTDEIKQHVRAENNNEICDLMKCEELTILNAIPTAEGAIQIAMEKSKITIHNSNCLILGFGRIGKVLAKMLLGIGAQVYCEARKQQDLSWIKAYGYNAIHLNEIEGYLGKFDFIFNTVPNLIMDKDRLQFVNKECLLVDLASKPGGIDFQHAQSLGLQTEWALALPGKVAAKTAAIYIYQVMPIEK